MIIDAHVHLSSYTGKGKTLNECVDVLLKEMQQNGIDYVIVIPDNIEDDPKITHLENTLELIKKTDKLFAMGSPQIVQRGSSEVSKYRELLEVGTIKGLKLFPGHEAYYPNDERCLPYYELLQELNYPIIIHTGDHSQNPNITDPLKYNDPKYIVEVAKKYPRLKVIITHFYWPKIDYCYEITKDVPNIYFELAGCADDGVLEASGGIEKMRRVLKQAINDRPNKVIFGTDWPLCDFEHHINLVRSLGLDNYQQELIFWKNADNIYKLGLFKKSKYSYKPYDSSFPKLYDTEKLRLSEYLSGDYEIEHIGSTAVPGLGGKGIIDIMIAAPKEKMKAYSAQLEKAGYEYVERASNEQRLFHWQDLPDPKETFRRYHIHLTYLESGEWSKAISFRDYLRTHPDDLKRYADTKLAAIEQSKNTKDDYMSVKEPVIQNILNKALSSRWNCQKTE